MVVDVRRAHWNADAQRTIYIQLPDEDWEEGDRQRVGRLNVSLYGTRDAAQHWENTHSEYLKSLGFQQGLASPPANSITLIET